jgi:DNA-binding NtrC family response regulator
LAQEEWVMHVQSVSGEPKAERPVDGSETRRPGLKQLVADYERRLIQNALDASGGHQRRAAALLGILPTTLLEKMKRLGIHRTRSMENILPRALSRP